MENEVTKPALKKHCNPAQKIVCSFIGTDEEKVAFEEAISKDTFINATTFIEQLGFLCEFLRSGSLKVKYRQIGNMSHEIFTW